jgi:eukaryotic translation initiation factor 2C
MTGFFNRRRPEELTACFARETDRRRVGKFLYNVSIDTTYKNAVGRRHYKIKGLSPKPAEAITIDVDGTDMSMFLFFYLFVGIPEYFAKTYNIRLQYPFLPFISAGGKVLIPFELCTVRPNQRKPGRGTDEQTAEMIKKTAAFPQERQERVYEGIRRMHSTTETQAFLSSWGIPLIF